MHAKQAPSGVFIIPPRSLVPVVVEERERATWATWATRRRRWRRHRRRRTFDTVVVGERPDGLRRRRG